MGRQVRIRVFPILFESDYKWIGEVDEEVPYV